MRHARVCLFGACFLALAGCSGAFKATAPVDEAVAWAGFDRVLVRTTNGAVTLEPGDGPDVRITGERWARGATLDEANGNLARVELHVAPDDARPGTLVVELRYPEELRRRGVGASLSLALPEACGADVQTGNGAIRARRLRGGVVLRTSNGHVEVTDADGPVQADTSNGAVTLADIRGAVEVDTSNGSVTLRNVQGDAEIETSNGRIEVTGLAGSLVADSSNGSIAAEVAPPAGGRVRLCTSNGGVRLALPAALGADLRLSTSNGRVTAHLPEGVLKERRRGKTHLDGTLNGGGCAVSVDTSNGSITLETQG